MNEINNEPAYSKNVIEFLTVANEYCLFIEKSENYSKIDILQFLQKISPLLYLKGSLLPVVNVENKETNERFVTEEQWETIFNELRKKFNKDDNYWFIDFNSPDENDPVKASLAENFADIYQDLKDFVMLYQKNTRAAKQNAVYECKLLFKTHWGYCITNAQKAIHHLLYKNNSTYNYTESVQF